MSRPTVAVVLPVHDGAWCIVDALESVFAQTRPLDEVIVVDDASTDGTADLVAARYGERVRLLRVQHRNAAASRNAGVAVASSEWLLFLDADDVLDPRCLEAKLALLEREPSPRWVVNDGYVATSEGREEGTWLAGYFEPLRERVGDLFEPLVHRCFPLFSSALIARDAYLAVGGMDPAMVYTHDYDLMLRLAARDAGAILPEPLMTYRRHAQGLSRLIEERHVEETVLMERIAAGALRPEPALRRLGELRASALAFQVGIAALRRGRVDEARRYFARSRVSGPWPRRLLATCACAVPAAWWPRVRRLGMLKGGVQAIRELPFAVRPRGMR